ncbi:MAG TPA: D-lyxose/D-mannose family sugar isomerase [Clostridiaceae bacterium]
MKFEKHKKLRAKILRYFDRAGIALTSVERKNIEIADFGLKNVEKTGLQLVTYINTERVCAKEMVLLPHQTCPEHRHPDLEKELGKEETFRCRKGKVYLYVEGEETKGRKAHPPKGDEAYYTVYHEIVLKEGEQYIIYPSILHWFQGGKDGAVISEFSTKSTDEADVFTDPRIKRIPEAEA